MYKTFCITANRIACVRMLKQVDSVTGTLAFNVNQTHVSISTCQLASITDH